MIYKFIGQFSGNLYSNYVYIISSMNFLAYLQSATKMSRQPYNIKT
jgi:hypothetical protein